MNPVEQGNLFDVSGLTHNPQQEILQSLLQTHNVRLERIVSQGHVTPTGAWYDQDWDEWVLLLSGAARLQIEGEAELRRLRPGDYVYLPAHRRHRVEWTDTEQETVWLALHLANAAYDK